MDRTEIGYLIKSINDKMKVRADTDMKSRELTFAQCRVLGFLHDHGGQASQKEIEDYFEIAHPTVVGLVARAEKKGYLETWFNPADGRSKLVRLTPRAEQIGEEMERVIAEQEAGMTRGLTADQVQEFRRMLAVVYHNLI